MRGTQNFVIATLLGRNNKTYAPNAPKTAMSIPTDPNNGNSGVTIVVEYGMAFPPFTEFSPVIVQEVIGVVQVWPPVPERVAGTLVPVPLSAQIVWAEVVSTREVASGEFVLPGARGAAVNFKLGGVVGVPPPTIVYETCWGRMS